MADCWVVAKVQTGFDLRADWMAVTMAAEKAVKLVVNQIRWMGV